ncbi:MAG: hypothetical protein WB561_22690 [Terracidiphilus sp.]
MNNKSDMTPQRLKTPRAAAIAGIVFSLLVITSFVLIRISIPATPTGPAADFITHLKELSFALNLLPFAGIAFLWFIAVLRDRLGELEDRFFATVFLGSGLLYIATIFELAVVAGGLVSILRSPESLSQSGAYALGRAEIYEAMYTFATKMAGAFMITTSTISLRTRIYPRWMAMLGYAFAVMLLLSAKAIVWISLVFPLWVLLISVYILAETFRDRPALQGK